LVPILESSAHPPAWRIAGNPPLRFVHRQTRDADIFFAVNRATWPVDTPVTFRIKDRMPEFWDPDTGTIESAPFQETSDGRRVKIQLAALESILVVFRPEADRPPKKRGMTSETPEPITIEGPWIVEFPAGSGAPSTIELQDLKSWTEMPDSDICHFSGIATYRSTFSCPQGAIENGHPASLDLGRAAEVCEVSLNGQPVGIAWHPPYRLRVTDALRVGKNHLEIRVANLWHNRIVGDAALDKEERITRMVPESHYQRMRNQKLVESGLMGPVRIDFR
jgi:hypothetical protein